MHMHVFLPAPGEVLRLPCVPYTERRISGLLFQQSRRGNLRPEFFRAQTGPGKKVAEKYLSFSS
jgi:hypothetical protein